MRHLRKFNEENESIDLDLYKKKLKDIDKKKLKDIAKKEKDYNYYVGSVSSPGYALYHGTFKGFYTHDEVLEYIKLLKSKNVKSIQIFSPIEYKEIEKIRNRGQ